MAKWCQLKTPNAAVGIAKMPLAFFFVLVKWKPGEFTYLEK